MEEDGRSPATMKICGRPSPPGSTSFSRAWGCSMVRAIPAGCLSG